MELLVRVQGNQHPVPAKRARNYRAGDVVSVQPVGWHWGRKELGPGHPLGQTFHPGETFLSPQQGNPFFVVRLLRADGSPLWVVPNGWNPRLLVVPLDPMPWRVRQWVDPWENLVIQDESSDAGESAKRNWGIVMTDLPPAARQALRTSGFIARRWVNVRDFFRRRDGARGTPQDDDGIMSRIMRP